MIDVEYSTWVSFGNSIPSERVLGRVSSDLVAAASPGHVKIKNLVTSWPTVCIMSPVRNPS